MSEEEKRREKLREIEEKGREREGEKKKVSEWGLGEEIREGERVRIRERERCLVRGDSKCEWGRRERESEREVWTEIYRMGEGKREKKKKKRIVGTKRLI